MTDDEKSEVLRLLEHDVHVPDDVGDFWDYNDQAIHRRILYYHKILEGTCGKRVWRILEALDALYAIQQERKGCRKIS